MHLLDFQKGSGTLARAKCLIENDTLGMWNKSPHHCTTLLCYALLDRILACVIQGLLDEPEFPLNSMGENTSLELTSIAKEMGIVTFVAS